MSNMIQNFCIIEYLVKKIFKDSFIYSNVLLTKGHRKSLILINIEYFNYIYVNYFVKINIFKKKRNLLVTVG